MNDDRHAEAPVTAARSPRVATIAAAVFVLVLAAAAILVPHLDGDRADAVFLVLDPLGSMREVTVYQPLARWLSQAAEYPLRLMVVASLEELGPQLWGEVVLVLCPDGAALDLPGDGFAPLAVGRRQVPRNLRPRSVLVYSKAAGQLPKPWLTVAERTILGDSLSLAGCGVMRQGDMSADPAGITFGRPPTLGCGPDPYDHTPVLHALRLGCFDYAVVSELAVDRFLKAGLLNPVAWGIENLSEPLPGVVVMVAENSPAAVRVRIGEVLVGLGRRPAPLPAPEMAALTGLVQLGLNGFNLLLENDFNQLRRQFDRQWPPLSK